MYPKKQFSNKVSTEKGQGLAEYALILMLAGLVVIGISLSLGPQIEDVFSRFVTQAPVAPPALLAYTPPPTLTPTPTPDPAKCYTLTVNVVPGSSGGVSVSPARNCGSQYKDRTEVRLIASANSGYSFSNWNGDASGTNPSITVLMSSNKNVSASFSKICYSLTTLVSPSNGGTITASPAPNCGVKYNMNTVVTLTAAPAVGSTFRNWSGDASGTNPTTTVTMNSDKSATATFDQFCYSVETAVSPSAGGSVAKSPAPNCGTKYTDGTIVTLFAAADSNYQFSSWTGDVTNTNPSVTVTMNGNKNVTANFTTFCYALTTAVSPGIGGNITASPAPNCGTKYATGTIVTLSAVPSSGYQFNNWTGDATGTVSPVTVTMNGDRSASANFSQLCYAVTTSSSPSNGGTVTTSPAPNCGSQYTWGTQVSFTASPAPNFSFTSWGGNASGSTNPTTLTINSAANVVANFTAAPPPTPGPTLSCTLALGKTVASSSVENGSYPDSNAVDGNFSTRWSSNYNDNNWIYVDLGARYDVSRVILSWEAAYGRDYQIQVSDDFGSWTTIQTITNGNGGTDDMTSLTGQGRYVRMLGLVRATQWGYSLWEFEICGTLAPVLIASEDFESNSWSGGTGWAGNWTTANESSIVNSGTPYAGTRHMRLADDGTAERGVNLSGRSRATLTFYWKVTTLQSNDKFYAQISTNGGSTWTPVLTVDTSNDNMPYAKFELPLDSSYLTSNFKIKFNGIANNENDDYFYVDNITITGN